MVDLACELMTPYSQFSVSHIASSGYKFAEMEMSEWLSACGRPGYMMPMPLIAEVILSTLLPAFAFELPNDKEICWNLAGIQYPTVGTISSKAEMPLQISSVKGL